MLILHAQDMLARYALHCIFVLALEPLYERRKAG